MKKFMVFIFAVLIAGYASAQTKTAVQTADLNKAITDHIAKNYVGYKIVQAYKVVTNKVVTFEVTVQKETTKSILVYSDKGEFVKVKTPATKPVNKTTPAKSSGTKPVHKTTPATTKDAQQKQ